MSVQDETHELDRLAAGIPTILVKLKRGIVLVFVFNELLAVAVAAIVAVNPHVIGVTPLIVYGVSIVERPFLAKDVLLSLMLQSDNDFTHYATPAFFAIHFPMCAVAFPIADHSSRARTTTAGHFCRVL